MSNVLKVSKKVLTVGTVMSTMLWSVGVAALLPVAASAAACPTFQSGDLLKVSGKPAIYAVDSNGKVLYFPSGDEFKSWNVNESYGGYTTVSQECYDALPVPSMSPYGVNFRPGSHIVKRASSDQLYVVEPGNVLAKITAEAANALYGVGHKTLTVADVFWPNYSATRGADVTEAKVHPGMLVSNGGKTWYVSADSKLWEVTAAGMSANRFKAAFVRPVAASAVAGLAIAGTLDATNALVADRTQTGGGSSVIPGTTGGAVTVSLAANNPAGATLASGSSFNQVLKLNLTAGSQDASVTGLTLRKGGFVANSNISGIDLIDSAGVRHGNVASSVNTDNDVTLLFANAPITVKAGTTEVVTVRVNLLAGSYSSTVSFNVLSASSVASNGSVGGSFPVSGNAFSIQDGSNSLGNATLNIAAINASGATLSVDANNQQEIAKFTLVQANSKESIKLSKLVLYNNGTAADSDVMDVQLVAQDGSVLATAQQVNKNVTFDLSASPYLIDKGQTKNFTVRAKIVNGAARTIQFVVYNDYDVVITGTSTLTSILPSTTTGGTSGAATTFPVGNKTSYNLVTVGSGTISFNKDTSSPSAAVAPNANGVVLAKYFAKPNGESMELRKITLGLQSASLASMYSGSFTVKVNGASVYSGTPSDITSSTVSLTSITLSTYPVLTAGQNNYITIEANIASGASNGATTTVYMDLTEVKRLVTNDITDPSVSISQANQISVQAAALKISTLATPVTQSIVVGTSGVTLAQVELNPSAVSSGEDVRVSAVTFTDTLGGSGGMGDISNLALYDQNGNVLITSASTALNATTSAFTLVNPITISKTGAVILTLKGDVVANNGSGTHTFKVNATGDVTATGKDTGNTPSRTLGSGTGQALTVASSGTLTLSLVSGSNAAPSNDQIVSVGQTNVSVFAFKLTAQKEPMKVTSLTLTATGTIRTLNDLSNIKLFRNNETTPFASANQLVAGNLSDHTAVFTWTATDNLLVDAVQPNAPVTIYVKADIGTAGQAILGDSFVFKVSSTGDIVTKGSSSGSAGTVSGSALVTGVTYIAPFSVSVAADAPTAGSSVTQAVLAGTQIARVKLSNNGSAQVTVTGIKFTDSGSHSGTTSTYKLYYSDLNSSNYVGNVASSTMGTSTSGNNIDFSNLSTQGTSFSIDGGAYRFVTVAVNTIGSAVTGDTWQLSVASIGDVKYTATEANLGYDTNNDGDLSGSTYTLYADGKPSMGTLIKQ